MTHDRVFFRKAGFKFKFGCSHKWAWTGPTIFDIKIFNTLTYCFDLVNCILIYKEVVECVEVVEKGDYLGRGEARGDGGEADDVGEEHRHRSKNLLNTLILDFTNFGQIYWSNPNQKKQF